MSKKKKKKITALIRLWLDNWSACKCISPTNTGHLPIQQKHPDNGIGSQFSFTCIYLNLTETGQCMCVCFTTVERTQSAAQKLAWTKPKQQQQQKCLGWCVSTNSLHTGATSNKLSQPESFLYIFSPNPVQTAHPDKNWIWELKVIYIQLFTRWQKSQEKWNRKGVYINLLKFCILTSVIQFSLLHVHWDKDWILTRRPTQAMTRIAQLSCACKCTDCCIEVHDI